MQLFRRITSFFHRNHEKNWDLKDYERAFEQVVAESIAQGEIELSDIDSITEDNFTDLVADTALELLNGLKRRAPKMLREHRRLNQRFQVRNYNRWKDGLNLLKMMLVISCEVGSAFNALHRPLAAEKNDFRFEALINLHARALRVSEEINALLLAGFPDGALSRWRTLHEIAVIMTFLQKCEPSISERFVIHRKIVEFYAMQQYRKFQDRANLEPIDDTEFETAKSIKDAIVETHGNEMLSDYGWATPALDGKKSNLFELEKHVGLDHWRPRFKWACDDIHGGYHPIGSSLGASEAREPLLLVGASNSGFTDPAHMMAISLNLANHALFLDHPSLDNFIFVSALSMLSDEIGDTFLKIDSTTGPDPGKTNLCNH